MAAIVAEGFLSRLSFGIISFALPLYAFRELGMGLAAVGVLVSLNLVVAIALKPAMGALADRIGLKRSFTASIGMRSAVSLLLVFAVLPWQLFAIRTIHGVSISLRDPSVFVLIADHGGKKAIASAFAWYQTAKSVAGALGKGAGGVLLGLTASNFSLVFLIAFVLSALPILVVLRYVREPGHDAHAARTAAAAQDVLAPTEQESSSQGSSRPAVLPFAGFGFLVSSTAYMLANLFPIFAVEYAGLTAAQAGVIYMIAASLTLSGPFFGWLSDHVSRRLVLSVLPSRLGSDDGRGGQPRQAPPGPHDGRDELRRGRRRDRRPHPGGAALERLGRAGATGSAHRSRRGHRALLHRPHEVAEQAGAEGRREAATASSRGSRWTPTSRSRLSLRHWSSRSGPKTTPERA
jgi:MFS family permease